MTWQNKIKVLIRTLAIFFILIIPLCALADEPAPKATGVWAESREDLYKNGIEIISVFTLDDTWNLAGGIKRSPVQGDIEGLFNFGIKFDTKPILKYEGGTFYIEYSSHHGVSPSLRDVGAYNNVDNIEAHPYDELYECWYKQTFGSDDFWLLMGKTDGYDFFTQTPHSTLFLNASLTYFPTILFFPTYPDPAMSIIGSFPISENCNLKMAVYDGSLAEGVETGKLGLIGNFFDDLSNHAFCIAQFDFSWNWKDKLPGILSLGGWSHSAKFLKFNGQEQSGALGPYVTVDQMIYKKKELEASLFLFYSYVNPSISIVTQYFASGITWQGLFCGRGDDHCGLSMSRSNFSSHSGLADKSEQHYEAFYQWRFTKAIYLLPDFQYIVNPGGQGLPNASVFTLRLDIIL